MLAVRFLKEHQGVAVGHVMDVPDEMAAALAEQGIVECIESGEPEKPKPEPEAKAEKAKAKAKAKSK